MQLEYRLPFRKAARQRTFFSEPSRESSAEPPRIARMLALAHQLDQQVQSGVVKDYVALARVVHVSPARVSQILLLIQLAPSIQERILLADYTLDRLVGEADLRKIAHEPVWETQVKLFELLIRG
jgi:hypothetical protein